MTHANRSEQGQSHNLLMANDQDIAAEEDHVKRIRITSHGKMKGWVAFSLQFLLDEASDCKRIVVLDTLPVSAANTSPSSNTLACLHPSTSTVSRLISVVEIIKREYLKTLEITRSTRLHGLHQYNEIGTLEDLGLVAASSNDGKDLESAQEVERSRNIIEAISGKHFTRRKETPFMRITLSASELPELVEKNATYQPPTCRKLSKSAKGRARKRAKALRQT